MFYDYNKLLKSTGFPLSLFFQVQRGKSSGLQDDDSGSKNSALDQQWFHEINLQNILVIFIYASVNV